VGVMKYSRKAKKKYLPISSDMCILKKILELHFYKFVMNTSSLALPISEYLCIISLIRFVITRNMKYNNLYLTISRLEEMSLRSYLSAFRDLPHQSSI
jgi:hypothetical protein